MATMTAGLKLLFTFHGCLLRKRKVITAVVVDTVTPTTMTDEAVGITAFITSFTATTAFVACCTAFCSSFYYFILLLLLLLSLLLCCSFGSFEIGRASCRESVWICCVFVVFLFT